MGAGSMVWLKMSLSQGGCDDEGTNVEETTCRSALAAAMTDACKAKNAPLKSRAGLQRG
jgi:hypothetical protein